jgi:hypothetical protein
MNPIWPDAQPYDTYIFVAVAALVLWSNRKVMFTREGAVTEVIPQTECNVMSQHPGLGTATDSETTVKDKEI